MRKATSILLVCILGLMATPAKSQDDPTINGVCDDAAYVTLAEYTQARGFGDWGLISLKAYSTARDLFICVSGTTEANFNSLFIWLDVESAATGVPAGTQLPTNGSPFDLARPTLELPNTDGALRFAHGNAGELYVNAATYINGVGSEGFVGGPYSIAGTPSAGVFAFQNSQFAYKHNAGGVSTNPGNEGFEMRIRKFDLGLTSATIEDNFRLFVAYASGSGDFFSSDVLPEVTGNGSNNLARNPNFTTLAGTQIAGPVASPAVIVDRNPSGPTNLSPGGRFFVQAATFVGENVFIELRAPAATGEDSGDGNYYQKFPCTYDDTTNPPANWRCDVFTGGGALPKSFEDNTVHYQYHFSTSTDASENNYFFTGFDWSFATDATGSPLPVELTSFSALASGRTAILSWMTASETNNAGFEVETLNGSAWTSLGFVEGQGTTDQESSYRFTTGDLALGVHTFRLRQVDFDGTTSFSPTVEVAILADDAMVTLTGANPFHTETAVQIATPSAQQVRATLYDVLGRQVAEVFSGEVSGVQNVRVNVDVPAGMYFLRVTGDTFSHTTTLTRVR